MSTLALFDYEGLVLDVSARAIVKEKTGRIRDRVKRSTQDLIEIGLDLIDIKEQLGHGMFGSWLAAEFDFSDDTAENLMNAAIKFRNFRNLSMAPSALYLMSRPSTPASAVEEAIEQANNGQHLTHSVAKEIVGRHKPPKAIETHKPERPDAHTAKAPTVEQDESDPESRAEEESQETELEEEVDRTPDPEAVPVNGRRVEVDSEIRGEHHQGNEEDEPDQDEPPEGSVTTYKCPVCPKEYYAPVWHCLNCQTHNPSGLMTCKDCRTLRGDQPPPVAVTSPALSAEKELHKDELLKAMSALSGRIEGLRPYTLSAWSQYSAHKRKRSAPTVKRLYQLTGELLHFLQGGEA